MSLPAASAPVAVLVLAWDETTPAARVLVEATDFAEPAPDSVVVLVPTGPPTNELTQEEFLPLDASPALPQLPLSQPAEAPGSSAIEATNTQETARLVIEETKDTGEEATDIELPTGDDELVADALPEESSPATAETSTPPPPVAEAATAAALTRPALVWQEVRVLRLGSYASYAAAVRPALVWTGVPAVPAAPYLGSAEEPGQPDHGTLAAGNSAVAAALQAATGSVASALGALRGLALPSAGPASALGSLPALSPIPAYVLTEQPAAPDAESDATPVPSADEPAPSADASTTELGEEVADPTEDFTVDVSPVQTELLPPASALAEAPEAPEATETQFFSSADLDMSPGLAALRPAGRPFDAPNLNFQIIQYARLAVPQALAEQPYGVIYAPAWPTWLAAQELRHRSGQPLVLHIAQLAAADDELIDLAAGWAAEIQRQALHRADLILTETPALAQRLRHELALPAHRVRAVPAADAVAVAQALRTAQRH